MTPVPLDLPLRPSEAAELAHLVFDLAESKPLAEEVRSRIAARGAVLRLETVTPWFGSLERDPVHPSSYYLAVDGAAGEPLLLHMAVAAAPTSSVFFKPLLIGRMRRPNGPEIILNTVPFGPAEQERLAQFAGRIDSAFLPRPHGSRVAVTMESRDPEKELPAAFEAFRAVWKRTGKNIAAVAVPPGTGARRFYYAALWAAIRAGWREGYCAGVTISSKEEARDAAMFSKLTVAVNPGPSSLEAAARLHEAVRVARSSLKTGRSFDLEIAFDGAVSPGQLEFCLDWLRERGHAAQLVSAAANTGTDLAAAARRYQCGLNAPATSHVEAIAEIAERLLG